MHNIPVQIPGNLNAVYFSQNVLVCLSVHLSVFVIRVGYQTWESGCEQPNPFLSLSAATNINCLLNGSLQSFGTTNVKVLLFHLELLCGRCSFTPAEKRETHQIQLLVQRFAPLHFTQPRGKPTIQWFEWGRYWGWNTEGGDN